MALVVVATTAGLAGCAVEPVASSSSTSDGARVTTIDICDAALLPIGEGVTVRGEFDGFGYDLNSRLIVLKSSDLCNDRGAGAVFAHLASNEDRDSYANARTGEIVEVQGTITEIDEGRFVTVENASAP